MENKTDRVPEGARSANSRTLGSRRAVADLHSAARRSEQLRTPCRSRTALVPYRWKDAVRRHAAVAGRKENGQASGVGKMARRAQSSADIPRDGESHLAAPFRHRNREDAGEFRQSRGASVASGTARLAG